jgi:hypothetical protein
MFIALHELRSGNDGAAARWASRSLRVATDHGLSYLAQTIDAIVATVKRRSPPDAAVLLGALRAHRGRKQLAGTQGEIDAESRYETSLRRQLGVEFDALYSKGQALDEASMITLGVQSTRRHHGILRSVGSLLKSLGMQFPVASNPTHSAEFRLQSSLLIVVATR